jgi:predicted transcriptional regulator of viral defense system
MKGFLDKFHELKIFTLDDATRIVKSKTYAMTILRGYIEESLVVKIRRNLYGVTNLATKHIEANRYEVASALTPTAYISYHSALEFYGMANQVFNTIYVASESRFNSFEFDGLSYMYAKSPTKIGIETPIMSYGIRVTGLERTVIDCIDRIDRSGGSEEMLQCFRMIMHISETKLLEVLASYDKSTLYKKSGFVLSRFRDRFKLSDDFFQTCRERANVGSKELTSYEDCNEYDREWNISYPDTFNSFDY